MKIDLLGKEAAARTGLKSWLFSVIGLSVLLNLALVAMLLIRGNDQRVVLVPPQISKTFWVQQNTVSSDYLVQMAQFIIQLYFDVSPDNVEFNDKILLSYVDPRFYGTLQSQAGGIADRMKRDNSSTFYAINGFTPDPANMTVVVHGVMNVFVGDQKASATPEIYQLKFAFASGRVLLTEIRKIDEKNSPETPAGG